jgi:antitoxin component YwqK of YwqJK toxin-antitoxin module
MKKSFIALALLSIIAFTSNAQVDTVFNQIDHLNRMQGHWKKHYRSGKIAYKGFFKDDKPRGNFIRYHENGIVSAKLIFSQCGDTAQASLFSPLGREVAQGKYLRKQKDGVWNYLNSSGAIVFTEEYKEGKKHGKFQNYYPSGQVFEMVTWQNDKKNGSTVQYYLNGQTKSMIFYKDGVEDGPVRLYYPDMEVRLEGNYAKGVKDGVWKFFDEKGKELKVIEYKMGVATNQDELVRKETDELEKLLKNIGKIQEPSIEEFVGGRGF